MIDKTTLFRFLHLALALGRGAAVMAVVCGAVTICRSGVAAPFFTVTSGSSFSTALESFLWVGPRDPVTDNVVLWEGATVGLSEPGFITLEYIGKEALYADNIFRWNGMNIFTTGPSSPLIVGQTAATPFPPVSLATYVVPGIVSAGTLPFSFFITEASKNVPNDSSNLDIGLWPLPPSTTGNPLNFGNSIYLMLDDENVVDSDHDDMIVRMSVSAVPEPGTLVLAVFGAGGAAIAARWRRNRRYPPWAASQRSASRADMQPVPAAEIAWR
jgi:hypothetical protein